MSRRRRNSYQGGQFDPRTVAEVAAGYFWDPAAGSGSGTAQFLLPEGNGKSAYNIITPSASVAPALSTVNGRAVAVYANGAPDKTSRVSGTVQRGFTGAAMIWGWIHTTAANIGIVFGHFRTNQQFALQLNTADIRVYVHDGSSLAESRFPLPPGGYSAGPFYYEGLYVPSAGATSRIQLTTDRVAQVPNVAGSPGTSMQDLAEVLGFSASTADSSNFNISGDFSAGIMGVTSGIPSDDDRNRLFNLARLKAA